MARSVVVDPIMKITCTRREHLLDLRKYVVNQPALVLVTDYGGGSMRGVDKAKSFLYVGL